MRAGKIKGGGKEKRVGNSPLRRGKGGYPPELWVREPGQKGEMKNFETHNFGVASAEKKGKSTSVSASRAFKKTSGDGGNTQSVRRTGLKRQRMRKDGGKSGERFWPEDS